MSSFVRNLCSRIGDTPVMASTSSEPTRTDGIVWLARRYAQQGLTLEAGQTVLAGSFTRPLDIAAGDGFRFDYGPLGTFGLRFS